MNKLLTFAITGLLTATVGFNVASAAPWCGYNANATLPKKSTDFAGKANHISQSQIACQTAPEPIKQQLISWKTSCDLASQSSSTTPQQDTCNQQYACIKSSVAGNPCFIPGAPCTSTTTKFYNPSTKGCTTCSIPTPKLNPTTLKCEACPSATPQWVSSGGGAGSCNACPAATPRYSASDNKCVACSLPTPYYNASKNTCEACPIATPQWVSSAGGLGSCKACPVATPRYNAPDNKCVACSSSTPYYNASKYTCEACTGSTPLYNASFKQCVSCPPSTPQWDAASKTCKACPSAKPVYNASSNTCNAVSTTAPPPVTGTPVTPTPPTVVPAPAAADAAQACIDRYKPQTSASVQSYLRFEVEKLRGKLNACKLCKADEKEPIAAELRAKEACCTALKCQ